MTDRLPREFGATTETTGINQRPRGGRSEILWRLERAGFLMKLSTTRVVEGLGLSFSEHTLLTALVAVDTALTQTQLADRTGLSPSGITNQIDRLERRGLVERTPDVRDRRAIVVRLTDEGRRLVWQALDAVEDEQNEVLEALSPAEIEAFTTTLRRVSRILRAGDAWNSSQRP